MQLRLPSVNRCSIPSSLRAYHNVEMVTAIAKRLQIFVLAADRNAGLHHLESRRRVWEKKQRRFAPEQGRTQRIAGHHVNRAPLQLSARRRRNKRLTTSAWQALLRPGTYIAWLEHAVPADYARPRRTWTVLNLHCAQEELGGVRVRRSAVNERCSCAQSLSYSASGALARRNEGGGGP